jgi:hypothetical protein
LRLCQIPLLAVPLNKVRSICLVAGAIREFPEAESTLASANPASDLAQCAAWQEGSPIQYEASFFRETASHQEICPRHEVGAGDQYLHVGG